MGKIIQKSDLASFISSQNIILETSEQFPILGDYSVLKGQSAYPGKVTGRVRKILTSQAVKFFRQGEILVAPMTTVDFTSAIKSCAAFITDEGGITSHAAIVARELKKPCIIGTKIATRVLQDGDLVEVDANKGIVKVIKKA
ncbi:MAG: PEP-utilizing enzyme [archaeon]